MFRHDFLKAFGAAAAALADGGTTIASLPAHRARAAPPAIVPGYSSGDQVAEFVRLLRKTRCISISQSYTAAGVAYYTTVHRDERDPFGANLNNQAWAMLDAAKAKPRSVSIQHEVDEIDFTFPYDGGRVEKWRPDPAVKVIEVEWVGLA